MTDWDTDSGVAVVTATTRIRACARSLTLAVLMAIGTAVSSIGGYYDHIGAHPHITGTIAIPKATLAFGVISLALTILAQAAIKRPSKLTFGLTTILLGIGAAAIGITAAIAVTEEANADERIKTNLREYIHLYKDGTLWSTEIDEIQQTYLCCGESNSSQYALLEKYQHGATPTSCCERPSPRCGQPPHGDRVFKTGCSAPLTKAVKEAINTCTITLTIQAAGVATTWLALMLYWTFAGPTNHIL